MPRFKPDEIRLVLVDWDELPDGAPFLGALQEGFLIHKKDRAHQWGGSVYHIVMPDPPPLDFRDLEWPASFSKWGIDRMVSQPRRRVYVPKGDTRKAFRTPAELRQIADNLDRMNDGQ